MAKKSKSGGGGKVFLGFILGVAVAAAGLFLYLRFNSRSFSSLPFSVAHKPLPYEKQIARPPEHARTDREVKTPPFGISEDVFESGAHVYRARCASCHGVPGHDVTEARSMHPRALQLWKRHGEAGVVGVSDQPAGETYWKISKGMHLSGMPAFQHVLTDTQIWQVSLLLKNANTEMPLPVMKILKK